MSFLQRLDEYLADLVDLLGIERDDVDASVDALVVLLLDRRPLRRLGGLAGHQVEAIDGRHAPLVQLKRLGRRAVHGVCARIYCDVL